MRLWLLGAAIVLAACDRHDPSAATAAPAPSAAVGPAASAPPAAPAASAPPTSRRPSALPNQTSAAKAARRRITRANYKAELAKLDAKIPASPSP